MLDSWEKVFPINDSGNFLLGNCQVLIWIILLLQFHQCTSDTLLIGTHPTGNTLGQRLDLTIFNLIIFQIILNLALHLIVLLYQVLYCLYLFFELSLFFITLRYKYSKLLLDFVSFLISCVCHLYNFSHSFPLALHMFFQVCVYLFK